MSASVVESIELQQRNVPGQSSTNDLHGEPPADRDGDVAEQSLLVDSTVPEGGYGWVVVASCSVIMFWFTGINYSWGVVQAALVHDKISSPSTLSFVGSLTTTFIAILAIVNARVIRALGARSTALLGIGCLGIGSLLSSFTTGNVGGLFATVSVISGVGTSLCFMVCSVTPPQYFNEKRGLVSGIVYGAGGLGGAVISIGFDALIRKVGIEWSYRIFGILILATGLPAAWFMKERVVIRRSMFVEWHLLKDIRFILLFVTGLIATFPLFVPPFFLPLYVGALGLSSTTGATIVAAFNLSSAAGRILTGFLSDKVGPVNSLLLSLVLDTISLLVLWPVSESLAPLLVFVIICGAANGGFFAVMPTVVGSMFGSARVSVAMGMIVTGWAGGYLMGAPIAAYLLDAQGGNISKVEAYRPAMYYAGSLALASTGLCVWMRFNMNRSIKKRL